MNIHSNILYFLSSPSICVQIFEIGAIFHADAFLCACLPSHKVSVTHPENKRGQMGVRVCLARVLLVQAVLRFASKGDRQVHHQHIAYGPAGSRQTVGDGQGGHTHSRQHTRERRVDCSGLEWRGTRDGDTEEKKKKKHDRHTDFGERKEENSVSGAHPEDDGAGHIVFEEPGQGSSRQGSGGDSGEGAVGAGPGAKR